jgi:hypothetical protein
MLSQTTMGAVEIILKTREQTKMLMIIALWLTWSERNIIRKEGKRRCPRIFATSSNSGMYDPHTRVRL